MLRAKKKNKTRARGLSDDRSGFLLLREAGEAPKRAGGVTGAPGRGKAFQAEVPAGVGMEPRRVAQETRTIEYKRLRVVPKTQDLRTGRGVLGCILSRVVAEKSHDLVCV